MNKGWPWLWNTEQNVAYRDRSLRKQAYKEFLRSDKEKRSIRKTRKTIEYCETGATGRYVCLKCRVTFKATTNCPMCHEEMYYAGPRDRIPRKNASNRKWKEYERRSNGGHACR